MGATHLDETRPLPGTQPYEMILEFARAQKADDPYTFQFEEQEYRLRMKGGVTRSARFPWSDQLLEDLRALTRAQSAPEAARRLGEHLRRFLDELDWGGHEHVLGRTGKLPGELRVVIRSAAAELYALPWELVTLKDSGQHLADLPGCTVSYEWPTEREDTARSPVPERGRVLFAWSAAGGLVPVERHLRSLQQSCQKGGLAFDEQHDTLSRVTLSSLEERLSSSPEPISVLHVLCHGAPLETEESGAYGLVWNSSLEGRDKELVDGARLGALLAPYSDTLKLVVLCACHGGDGGKMASYLGSVAQEVHRAGIEVVVASRLPLSSTGSVLMTETLYQKLLAEDCSLEESLCAARRKLRVAGSGFDWAALQFYAHRAQHLFFGQRKQQEAPQPLTQVLPSRSAAALWMEAFIGLAPSEQGGDPSARALALAAKMASIQGIPVVRDVTLTGTVNPDGSVGPVDGLLQRLGDAAAAGKRTFGYPLGQRHDWDEASKQPMDLQGPAQERGVALQEVRDIYEAYELMTGQKLRRPQPVDTSAMKLSPAVLQRMRDRTAALQERAESSLAQLKQPSPFLEMLQPMLASAEQGISQKVQGLADDMVPAAYTGAVNAAVLTDAARILPRILAPVLKLELGENLNLNQEMAAVEAHCHAFMGRIGSHEARIAIYEPFSVERRMTLLLAYDNAMSAAASIGLARFYMARSSELVAQSNPDASGEERDQLLQQLLTLVMRISCSLSMARIQIEASVSDLEHSAGQEQQAMPEVAALIQLARAYASAAQVNFDFYEARMTQEQAQQVGQNPAAIPSDSYLSARTMMEIALSSFGQPKVILGAMSSLAAAQAAYHQSTQLFSRKYSLRVEEDESGNAVNVRRDKSFMAMLEWAELKARELAAEARETAGFVPVQAQVAYQLACAQREGSSEDKLNALCSFWSSSLASQTAVALATRIHEQRK